MAVYTDQSYGSNFDPGSPPPLPFSATVITITIDDVNNDGVINDTGGDTVNGSPVTAVYNGDTITIGGTTIRGATIYTADGGRYFTPTDNSVLSNGTISSVTFVNDSTQLDLGTLGPPCFTSGTLITTQSGDRPIDDLRVGDLVLTADQGYQPIRWIGSSTHPAKGNKAPILIREGALGNKRDLRVSPQHRMLLQGWQAELLFGEVDVLVAAKSLINDQSIRRVEGGQVTYFHILFDSHQIIWAEGAPSESFHPGVQGWASFDQATRDEILALFPQFADGDFKSYGPPARMSLKHREGALLAAGRL